ncbi:MAG: Ig-like domain-containing protein, partial [Gemmatimonadales bacterium]
MARAVRGARRQARRLGLLTALCAACAVIEEPPGGPPDYAAPVLVSFTPDSGAVVPELDDALRIQFDEVISEQSGGSLDQLIQFSPRVEELDVDWKRSAIEVKPKDGWRPGVVYQVELLAGVADLRGNRTEDGATIVFSTGTEIPATEIAGVVINWEEGQVGRNALIEASLLPDSLVYVTRADSLGEFSLVSVPTGAYWVTAAMDDNSNGRRESQEAFDSVTVMLDSAASHEFWAFARDTIGPQIRELAYVDSLTIGINFTQKLEPGEPDTAAVAVFS